MYLCANQSSTLMSKPKLSILRTLKTLKEWENVERIERESEIDVSTVAADVETRTM